MLDGDVVNAELADQRQKAYVKAMAMFHEKAFGPLPLRVQNGVEYWIRNMPKITMKDEFELSEAVNNVYRKIIANQPLPEPDAIVPISKE